MASAPNAALILAQDA